MREINNFYWSHRLVEIRVKYLAQTADRSTYYSSVCKRMTLEESTICMKIIRTFLQIRVSSYTSNGLDLLFVLYLCMEFDLQILKLVLDNFFLICENL